MLFTMIVIYMKQIHPSYYAQQCNLNHASNFPRWYGSMTPLFGHGLDTIFRYTHLNNCWFMYCIPLYPMSIHYIPIFFVGFFQGEWEFTWSHPFFLVGHMTAARSSEHWPWENVPPLWASPVWSFQLRCGSVQKQYRVVQGTKKNPPNWMICLSCLVVQYMEDMLFYTMFLKYHGLLLPGMLFPIR